MSKARHINDIIREILELKKKYEKLDNEHYQADVEPLLEELKDGNKRQVRDE
jgi:hypothetical protein